MLKGKVIEIQLRVKKKTKICKTEDEKIENLSTMSNIQKLEGSGRDQRNRKRGNH